MLINPTTPEEVKELVDKLKEIMGDEVAHSMEDDIYEAVLESISSGICTDPAGCAREALKSKRLDFARWCA